MLRADVHQTFPFAVASKYARQAWEFVNLYSQSAAATDFTPWL